MCIRSISECFHALMHTTYTAERNLVEYDLFNVKEIDLNFFEIATETILSHHFSWLGDYEVQERGESAIHSTACGTVSMYCRYFINQKQTVLARIIFEKWHPLNKHLIELGAKYYNQYLLLETPLLNGEHVYSKLTLEKYDYLQALYLHNLYPEGYLYRYTGMGELDEMLQNHLKYEEHFKEEVGVDKMLSECTLEKLITEWCFRSYRLNTKVYKYNLSTNNFKIKPLSALKQAIYFRKKLKNSLK